MLTSQDRGPKGDWESASLECKSLPFSSFSRGSVRCSCKRLHVQRRNISTIVVSLSIESCRPLSLPEFLGKTTPRIHMYRGFVRCLVPHHPNDGARPERQLKGQGPQGNTASVFTPLYPQHAQSEPKPVGRQEVHSSPNPTWCYHACIPQVSA